MSATAGELTGYARMIVLSIAESLQCIYYSPERPGSSRPITSGAASAASLRCGSGSGGRGKIPQGTPPGRGRWSPGTCRSPAPAPGRGPLVKAGTRLRYPVRPPPGPVAHAQPHALVRGHALRADAARPGAEPGCPLLTGVATAVKSARLTLSLPSAFHSRSCAVHSPGPSPTHSHPAPDSPTRRPGDPGGILIRPER